jgi:hypothetical protein
MQVLPETVEIAAGITANWRVGAASTGASIISCPPSERQSGHAATSACDAHEQNRRIGMR